MSRRNKPEPKPFYSVRGDFVDSVDRFGQQAGLLADAIRTAMSVDGAIPNAAVRKILQERLDAFQIAAYGKDDD